MASHQIEKIAACLNDGDVDATLCTIGMPGAIEQDVLGLIAKGHLLQLASFGLDATDADKASLYELGAGVSAAAKRIADKIGIEFEEGTP